MWPFTRMERDPNTKDQHLKIETDTNKTSMQILSELFGSFDAEPPVIVKKEKKEKDASKKSKKSKKKHKHKDKKHKKSKKKKKSSSSTSSDSDTESTSLDLSHFLVKKEVDKSDIEKIKIEGTSLSLDIKLEINKDETLKSESRKGERKEVATEKSSRHREKDKYKGEKTRKRRSDNVDNDYINYEEDRDKHYSKRVRGISPIEAPRYDRYEHRSKHRDTKQSDFYRSRDRPRSRSRDRSRHNTYKQHDNRTDKNYIDKKKLLEIARKNAVQMMKSGSLPGALTLGARAQEKMIAAIRMGGKSIEELTDFCKSLSKKEELGELSSLSEKEDSDQEFHHPFKLKDRPSTLTMNIRNAVTLPIKTPHERTTELRIQFPVSSGQQHRVNEEWVPVEKPKEVKTVPEKDVAPTPIPTVSKEIDTNQLITYPAIEAPPVDNLTSIVSQRLSAMRKLQEIQSQPAAITYPTHIPQTESWLSSLGQFTKTTNVQMLTQAELSSGFQPWAKKNQLITAAPVSGGMGMHLLQKMGWKPGEGLGKEKTGALEPLLLEVKLDKKGLVANEEQSKGKKKQRNAQTAKTLQGKHPVSLLGEFASKKKLGAPEYILDFECGPDHKKNFLFKVILDGVEYKPNVASVNKKEAKANAASVALKQMGLM